MRAGEEPRIADIMKLENWEVCGFHPNAPLLGKSLETGGELLGITEWIPAAVPGCVQQDLLRAGVIADPYFGMNSMLCEWVENRWWVYRTRFDFERAGHEKVHLHFQGLDYKAHIYLNQSFLRFHEGMFHPLALPVTDLLRPEGNELIVMFEHAPDEMGQFGRTSQTASQKSRFTYNWDFSTRMVPVGMWDKVYLKKTGGCRLENVWLRPEMAEGSGVLRIQAEVETGDSPSDKRVRATVYRNGGAVARLERAWREAGAAEAVTIALECAIPDPEPWHPNGQGEQALYEVVVELQENGRLSDHWNGRTGFRTLSWIRNEGAPDEALPYTLVVNGQRTYIKGVNLTPLDVLYGSVTDDCYARLVAMLKEANVNLVRVWGGGLIEKEIFYELCDRNGILVWQEFIQSSSGIDNVPSKDPHFLRLLRETAVHALKTKRNHVSLACWSGGNELTDVDGVPATYADENIAMLKELVSRYDPERYFLPTSASGPSEFLSAETPGLNHDVHGPWKYLGPEEHYRVFNLSDSLLHSEFGVDGCCSVRSMRRFLPALDRKVTSVLENLVWRHHGQWWDTLERSRGLFGEIRDLSSLAAASQWVQAEGLRYALEANRRRKYRNSGSIVWQFNEPWPNVSCTSLVDYYGVPKMAYHALRSAYRNVHLSLQYEKLVYCRNETFAAGVYVHNSGEERQVDWRADCFDLNGRQLWKQQGSTTVAASSVVRAGDIQMALDGSLPEIFAVRLRWGEENDNVYFFSTRPEFPFQPLLETPRPALEWTMTDAASWDREEDRFVGRFEVRNAGDSIAMFVRASGTDDDAFLYLDCSQNDSVLLPGESRTFEVRGRLRPGVTAFGSDRLRFICWKEE